MSDRFRSIALALRDYLGNTYDLISAVDAVMVLDDTIRPDLPTITTPDGSATWDWTYNRWEWRNDSLVERVLSSDTMLDSLCRSRKIDAIKQLRAVAGCGLKAAKDAVENSRVTDEVQRRLSDPWGAYSEPPF